MGQPPTDSKGNVLPHDDPDIQDDFGLLRRIVPEWIIYDQNCGAYRLSSMAFSESSTLPTAGMSVDVEPCVDRLGVDPKTAIVEDGGLVRLWAGVMRDEVKCWVGFDPLEENPCHAEVWDSSGRRGKKLKVKDRFEWVVRPSKISQN